ncbi:phosphopantetheine-binding protein [Streptomyces sp. NPDC001833]|uniref:acyl carrier protein n=1 Tax=Streptomyces sp. NPDC001833 TaxID=3154658 RepID=UPI00332E527F
MFVEYLSVLLSTVYQVTAPIDPEKTFQELELDSLSLAELGAQLEEEFGVAIADEDVAGTTTVARLAALLEARGAAIPTP